MTDVKGYTILTEQQKDLANEGKILEERVMRWLDKLHELHSAVPQPPYPLDHPGALATLGRRSIQQGFMWAIRSIFRPTRIRLPEDDVANPE